MCKQQSRKVIWDMINFCSFLLSTRPPRTNTTQANATQLQPLVSYHSMFASCKGPWEGYSFRPSFAAHVLKRDVWVRGSDQYTVSDDCTCRTYFCCFPLALANTFPRPFVPILSNFFKEQ